MKLKDAFALFDKNNDGFINFTELKDMLISMGTDTPNWKVRHVLNDVDQDGDGKINFAEFLNLMARKGLSPPEEGQSELEQMFAIFDRDGDGFITHTEMKRALEETGGHVADSEVESMIQEADTDKDGKVSFQEFAETMKNKHPDVYS
ncbi:calmodulin-like isoform X2 [Dreissena polymorpha]|uniref:calmodulin-like isoform X2 n=1 Tax=Dreissena polymorpha TaxID=45954 RepID=UPI002264AEA9|nr:calmodulin-like isoform X2 [Dreissena polymorpha]